MDAEMKSVHATGLTNEKEEKEAVTEEEEKQMWKLQLLGDQTANALLNCVYFYSGKLFGLRAQEHRKLSLDDIRIIDGNTTIAYYEKTSKTFHGGIADMKKNARTVKHICHGIENEGHKPCLVQIYKLYFSLVSKLKSKNAFYFQAFDNKLAFKNCPVGIHSLNSILPNLCTAIGAKRKTSHSLRVTCVTKLFTGKVEEKLIRGRSGHVSNSLLTYEKSSKEQELKVSNILNPPVPAKENLKEVNESSNESMVPDDQELPVFDIEDIDSLLKDYDLPEASASNIPNAWNYASHGPINISGSCNVTINQLKM